VVGVLHVVAELRARHLLDEACDGVAFPVDEDERDERARRVLVASAGRRQRVAEVLRHLLLDLVEYDVPDGEEKVGVGVASRVGVPS
jgi:hypothetical protein